MDLFLDNYLYFRFEGFYPVKFFNKQYEIAYLFKKYNFPL